MRTSRPLAGLAGLCLGALLLAGCSGGLQQASNGGSGSDASRQLSADRPAAARQDAKSSAGQTARQPTDQDDSSTYSTSNTETQIRERAIIRTGRMTIRTKDVEAAADGAEALLAGGEGYVGNIDSTTNRKGEPKWVQLVLRIPVDDYDRAVDELRKLGKVLKNQHESTDVTKELTDVESRIESQRTSIERLRALMSRAETVGQVVRVESELTTRESDLESLQSQHATLSAQTSLSTLTVRFERPPSKPAPPKPDDDRGFLVGLGAGWDALGTATQFTLTALGALLPFLVVLVVLAAWPAWYWRRTRTRRATT